MSLLIYYQGLSFSFDRHFCGYLLSNSFPFALGYILGLINFRIDVIMLTLLMGEKAAGWFSADYKLLEQFLLIPITLSMVLLPSFSKLSISPQSMHRAFMKTILPLLLFGQLIMVICYFFGERITQAIYGREFKPAAQYLFILSAILTPFFIKPVLEKVFYALKKQFVVCFIYSIGVLGNIGLNFFFIPRWGINGASFATLICEILVVGVGFFVYLRTYGKWSAKTSLALTEGLEERGMLY